MPTPDRRGLRFAAEAAFLVALAAGVAVAELHALAIAGIMLLGWAVVAALEWAAWREKPHYGHGMPPRYYVPRVSLPPPQPLEQVAAGYPEAQRDEAPTWIASAELRAELLGEWPVAVSLPPATGEEPSIVEGAAKPDEASAGTSRHSLDPFAEQAESTRSGRGAKHPDGATIEVPTRPVAPRPLPGRVERHE